MSNQKPFFLGKPSQGIQLYQIFYNEYGIVSSNIRSFDDFLVFGLRSIFATLPPIHIDAEDGYIEVTFANPYVGRPGMWESGDFIPTTPHMCREKSITYAADVHATLYVKKCIGANVETSKLTNVHIGSIPIMVGSMYCNTRHMSVKETYECKHDPGGYFVIRGNDKVIVHQGKLAMCKTLVFPGKIIRVEMQCELRSRKDLVNQTVVKMQLYKNKTVNVLADGLKYIVPINILLKRMGVEMRGPEDQFNLRSFLLKYKWVDRDGYDRLDDLENILNINSQPSDPLEEYLNDNDMTPEKFLTNLMPHIIGSVKEKAVELCIMMYHLMRTHLNLCDYGDRDNAINRRIETAGSLMYQLVRRTMMHIITSIHTHYRGGVGGRQATKPKSVERIDVVNRLDAKQFENPIVSAMAKGDWSVGNSDSSVGVGVCQMLQCYSFPPLGNRRMISVPTNKGGKQTKQRELHASRLGQDCPAETPEGKACGLVTNAALTALVTLEEDYHPILTMIQKYIGIFDNRRDIININGSPVGSIKDGNLLYNRLKQAKLSGEISIYTGISYNTVSREVDIRTMHGRVVRPLLVVGTGKLAITKEEVEKIYNSKTKTGISDLARHGKIEFVDAMEQDILLVAQTPYDITLEHTHCEIHPALLLGISASTIPFPDHNQSPRNVYQSAMCKQAAGISSTAFRHRTDNSHHVCTSMAKPLTISEPLRIIGYNNMPSGYNLVIAIMNYGGWNQEDSIMMSKSFVDRGGYRSYLLHTYVKKGKTEPRRSDGRIINPMTYNKKYLTEMGLPMVGTVLNDKDIVIAEPERYNCICIKTVRPQIVDRVVVTNNPIDGLIAKVVTREDRTPVVGDKFSARHGQKGVVGAILSDEDMPFDPHGIRPDIIINPQAIPSRMTVAMLIELVLSKVCCMEGELGNATAFEVLRPDSSLGVLKQIEQMLHDSGHQRHGETMLTNGMTGKMMKGSVFMGPVYYQRLKHMVLDKIQCRTRGANTSLVRQPVEGRAREGGLRLGEMERDCFIGMGASAVTIERFMNMSDKFQMKICSKCGYIGSVLKHTEFQVCESCKSGNEDPDCDRCKEVITLRCKVCGKSDTIREVVIPYAMKLMFQELTGMGVETRMIIEK